MKDKLNQKIMNSYEEHYGNHGIDINDIKSRLMFKTQNETKGDKIIMSKNQTNPTKKSHLATWLALAVMIVAFTLIVIFIPTNKKETKGQYENQVVTVSVNPSVSFATDDKGVVVGVYGDNDEGKMVIEGEELVGLTLEVALDKVLEIEVKCGYFVKSDDPEYNKIEITVSGETSPEFNDKVQKLQTEVIQSLDKLGIAVKDKVTMVKNDAHEALVNKALALDKTLDSEYVNGLSDDKIVALISAYYLEAAKFPTKELEELYNNFKESEIKLANVEAINEIEGGLTSLVLELQNKYKDAQAAIRLALAKFEEIYNDNFVKADSEYQKAYAKVKEAKTEVIKLRAEVASLEDNADKTAKQILLTAKEGVLDTVEKALTTTKDIALLAIQTAKEAVNDAFEKIDSLIVSEKDLQTIFDTKEAEIEDYLNTTKDEMLNKFEEKYGSQITDFVEKVQTQKTTLINNLKDYSKAE